MIVPLKQSKNKNNIIRKKLKDKLAYICCRLNFDTYKLTSTDIIEMEKRKIRKLYDAYNVHTYWE